MPQTPTVEIYVDGDACPVKEEVLRVATRHGLTVHMVGNSSGCATAVTTR